jgi:hypothetical protein
MLRDMPSWPAAAAKLPSSATATKTSNCPQAIHIISSYEIIYLQYCADYHNRHFSLHLVHHQHRLKRTLDYRDATKHKELFNR